MTHRGPFQPLLFCDIMWYLGSCGGTTKLLGMGGSLLSSHWSHASARFVTTDAKWTQEKTLWIKWLGFHLGGNIFSPLLRGLFVLHPVAVRGKWTNSTENRDQKIQSHPFLFLSLPSKLHHLARFVLRAMNILFCPVLTSRLDVEMVASSPILGDHEMFTPEIGALPHYSPWRPRQCCQWRAAQLLWGMMSSYLHQEQVQQGFCHKSQFLTKHERWRVSNTPLASGS